MLEAMRRFPVIPFVAAFTLALALRLLWLQRIGIVRGGDSPTYEALAGVLRGDPGSWFHLEAAIPPLYPLFLAVFGANTVGMVAQALVSAFTAPILGVAARPHFGYRAGVIAAVLVAVAPTLIFWSPYVLTETLALAVLAAALLLASRCLRSFSIGPRLLLGSAMGAMYLSRAALLAPMIVLATAGLVGRRRLVTGLLAVLLGFLFVVMPYRVQSVWSGGQAVAAQSQFWTLLWAGTQWTEVGRGTFGVDLHYPPSFYSLSADEQTKVLRDEFWVFVRYHPVEYIQKLGRKLVWFWLPTYPEWSRAHGAVSLGFLVPLYVLALVGAGLERHSRFTWTLVGVVCAVMLTSVFTIVDYDARYRLPAELSLIPLASVALARALNFMSVRSNVPCQVKGPR